MATASSVVIVQSLYARRQRTPVLKSVVSRFAQLCRSAPRSPYVTLILSMYHFGDQHRVQTCTLLSVKWKNEKYQQTVFNRIILGQSVKDRAERPSLSPCSAMYFLSVGFSSYSRVPRVISSLPFLSVRSSHREMAYEDK